MQFTCNGITVVKQPVANYYFFLYASDFNISEGNSFTVSAKAGNSCGFASSTTTFTLYRPTPCQCGIGSDCLVLPRMANNSNGVKDKTIFKLYPNPSNDIINIELENTTSTPTKSNASIYTMFGVQITNFEILEDKAIIDVKHFNKGMYILKINTDGKEENHQIIIQ
ncbi:MAG: T9SS type A sorting domain-containing protein [Flavobacterium sp.]|nr:T9SS type A sorting domain-containing protein [Flavobacterium sp.]